MKSRTSHSLDLLGDSRSQGWRGIPVFAAALLASTALTSGGAAIARDDTPSGPPEMSKESRVVEHDASVFKPDPSYEDKQYDAERQRDIYGGKTTIDEPRPLLELGRPQYVEGPFDEGINIVGENNLLFPGFAAYGDWRSAIAFNDTGEKEVAQFANRLNLDLDLKLTATERLHAFLRPFDQDGRFTRYEFAGDDKDGGFFEGDIDIETLFFEGDAGAIVSGITGSSVSWDLPFAVGLMPLIFQNGVWMEDAIAGVGFSLPALNSPTLDISNADITAFAGFYDVTSPAFVSTDGDGEDEDVWVYGMAGFFETQEGYAELGVGYLDGRDDFEDLGYLNVTASFTKRYGGTLSNSARVIWNVGQDVEDSRGQQTADGMIFLLENSLITSKPNTFVPYFNAWIGFDRPQSLARDGGAGGVLKNTGILFETDGLTGFPKLDDTGHDTWGGALGINYLFEFDQQLVVEAASVQMLRGDGRAGQSAQGDQYGVGFRYQIPVTDRVILRADGMYGFLDNSDDVAGIRGEFRVKF